MTAETILLASYPSNLVDALLIAYREIESNYAVRKWKASELDAGHFVEAGRRIIEHELTGSHTPLGKSLPTFSDAELRRYEQLAGEESLRILIPRVLKSIYTLRNKRGVGHLGNISPNEMDATLILYSVKWVLGEFVRLASGSRGDPVLAQQAVDEIIERRLDLIWKIDDKVRILNSNLPAREQVLVLLYDQNLLTEDFLRGSIEYKNSSNFRKLLRTLHSERLIEFTVGNPIQITPKGIISAEQLVTRLGTTSIPAPSGKDSKSKSRRSRSK